MEQKYKIGDRVRIKSLDWYNENKNHCGEIPLFKTSGLFVPDMSRYCNNIMTIKDICYGTCYRMKEDFWNYNWTDEMIEGLVEEETNDCEKCGLTRNSTRCLFMDNCPHNKQKNIIEIPKDYVIKDENGNEILTSKIILEKKKKEYPKTYTECSDILSVYTDPDISGYKGELLWAFQKLLVCRDAYWKIAGEEMGLGKPWEPDWNNVSDKYCIYFVSGDAWLEKCQTRQCPFTFPTASMRDAFKENFDTDLEICKELL